jgi:hypothetical protein
MTSKRVKALASYLECDASDISEGYKWYGEYTTLMVGSRQEYLVLTDREANRACRLYIEESLWAFNADFLIGYIPGDINPNYLRPLQEKCESANPLIRAMVGRRFTRLVEDAIRADGRGHFLSSYDGNEDEQDGYFIYRLN